MATALKSVEMLLRPSFLRLRPESLTRTLCSSNVKYQKNKDEETPEKPAEKSNVEKQKQAKSKLNLLLESMNKSVSIKNSESQLNLAEPKRREKKKEERKRNERNHTSVDSVLHQAVENVSSTYPNKKDSMKQALLDKLEQVAQETEKAKIEVLRPNKGKATDLKGLLNTLKIDHTQNQKSKVQPTQWKSKQPTFFPIKVDEVFSGKPSGIFTNAVFQPNDSIPKFVVWDKFAEKELENTITHPPVNGFEKMIQWTRQGKLWLFPIDNEQGWEDEKDVGFHEHIFLESHLDPWCPRRGPLRHFMELVCNGLSKNPYLTVVQKKEHIYWFRDFFSGQQKILVDTGLVSAETSSPRLSQ